MTTTAPIATMDRLIDKLDRLHSSPKVACRVLAILKDDDFETGELVNCLEMDPALASSVLRLVNSSYFGLARNVASLRQAVTFLGSRSLRLAVLSFGLLEQLVEDTPAEVYEDFWRRALTMASVGFQLASLKSDVAGDEAYSAGLLADVGLLLLAQSDTKAYVKLHTKTAHTTLLVESERERYGFDHGQLGARLLSRWNLPAMLTEAIEDHHDEPDYDEPLSLNTHAASLMADALWTPESEHVGDARELLESEYGLDLDGFITLAVDSKEMIQENALLHQVKLPVDFDCRTLMAQAQEHYLDEAMMAALDWDSLSDMARQCENVERGVWKPDI
jgi:HD-like signal output (HDOD) protein